MTQSNKILSLSSLKKTKLLRGSIASLAVSLSFISVSSLQADIVADSNGVDLTIRRIKAAHFLTQATMGATETEIKQLANQMATFGEEEALERWLDLQFNMDHVPQLEHAERMVEQDGFRVDSTRNTDPSLDLAIWNYRYYTWWDQALNHNDQLRQRMTWALSQIFVANGKVGNATWSAPLHHYDGLGEHAFGNYRDLLHFITYSSVMGEFLGASQNDKGDPELGIFPDENYAREIMQLFSIGVYQVNWRGRVQTDSNGDPIENYTNEDITELAKVMTGLADVPRAPGSMNFYTTISASDDIPMMMWEDHHSQGAKTFLGHTIPAGQSGDEDISDALDVLYNHPCTAPFIARRLIQRFTHSTPSINYLGRVSAAFIDNGSGVRGDFQAVLRAILLDPEARDLDISTTTLQNGQVLISVGSANQLNGRLREPALLMTHFLRYFELESSENATSTFTGYFKPQNLRDYTNQGISSNSNVFNYYSAEYLPTSGPAANKIRNGSPLVLPEFELLPRSGISMNQGIHQLTEDLEVPQRATIFSEPATLHKLSGLRDYYESSDSLTTLINEINLYMFYGSMPESLRAELQSKLNAISNSNSDRHFADAVAVLLNSADFAVTY